MFFSSEEARQFVSLAALRHQGGVGVMVCTTRSPPTQRSGESAQSFSPCSAFRARLVERGGISSLGGDGGRRMEGREEAGGKGGREWWMRPQASLSV